MINICRKRKNRREKSTMLLQQISLTLDEINRVKIFNRFSSSSSSLFYVLRKWKWKKSKMCEWSVEWWFLWVFTRWQKDFTAQFSLNHEASVLNFFNFLWSQSSPWESEKLREEQTTFEVWEINFNILLPSIYFIFHFLCAQKANKFKSHKHVWEMTALKLICLECGWCLQRDTSNPISWEWSTCVEDVVE